MLNVSFEAGIGGLAPSKKTSGRFTSPLLGSLIAPAVIPGKGIYHVEVHSQIYGGPPDSIDIANMKLVAGTFELLLQPSMSTSGYAEPNGPISAVVDLNDGEEVKVVAVADGTVTSVYSATIVLTRIAPK